MSNNTSNSESSIDIDQLSLEELNQLKNAEESRLQSLTSHLAQLRQASVKIQASHRAVSEMGPAVDGKSIMVPLTESVYVPGRIKDPNKLLIELGTGYFAEKTSKETLAYLDRKSRLVNANSENVSTVIQGTRRNLEAIVTAMQGKMLEIRARQEGRVHQAAANAE
jgi:prefoldin alpha subunit